MESISILFVRNCIGQSTDYTINEESFSGFSDRTRVNWTAVLPRRERRIREIDFRHEFAVEFEATMGEGARGKFERTKLRRSSHSNTVYM